VNTGVCSLRTSNPTLLLDNCIGILSSSEFINISSGAVVVFGGKVVLKETVVFRNNKISGSGYSYDLHPNVRHNLYAAHGAEIEVIIIIFFFFFFFLCLYVCNVFFMFFTFQLVDLPVVDTPPNYFLFLETGCKFISSVAPSPTFVPVVTEFAREFDSEKAQWTFTFKGNVCYLLLLFVLL
jgi:hypothetical protein